MHEHVAHEGKNPYNGLKKKGDRTHNGGACTPRLVTHGGDVALTIQQYLHGEAGENKVYKQWGSGGAYCVAMD